jgi:hypothetical protein
MYPPLQPSGVVPQPVPPPGAQPEPAGGNRGAAPEERPLADLLGKLSQDGSLLVKQEIALAKQELGDKARRLGTQATMLVGGGITLYTGALVLVAGFILLLAEVVAAWVAALLVGTAIATVGAVLLLRGKNNLEKVDLKPRQAADSVRRDIEAVKEAAHGA